jgi:S1-C subfamily serine protease
MVDKNLSKIYRVAISDRFVATAFAVRTKSGVKLATAGHVCDGLMDPKIPKELSTTAASDDKAITVFLRKEDFVLSGTSDFCVLASMPDSTPAFKIYQGSSSSMDVWSIGYPAGLPLSAVKGHVSGFTDVEMPSERPKELCEGEAYSWKSVMRMTMFGPMMWSGCMFKTDMLASTLTVAPGNSGSPVLNNNGELVGVISALDNRVPAGFAMIVPPEKMRADLE